MKMHPVKSSKIDVICYDEHTHKLRVSFREEKPRDFCHVPENTFTAFLNARSKNRFFKRNIEDSFPCWATERSSLLYLIMARPERFELPTNQALSDTSVSRSTMLLKYRNKPKFRFNKIHLRPLKNGRISKADDYFWKINWRLKAHYRVWGTHAAPPHRYSQSRFIPMGVGNTISAKAM